MIMAKQCLFLLLILLITPVFSQHRNLTKDSEPSARALNHEIPNAKLYLTSNALTVIDDLIPYLPFTPEGRSVCYITTAGYKAPWLTDNIKNVESKGFIVKPVDLELLSPDDLESTFQGGDLIRVGGGNTFYLLQEVRRTGFDKYLAEKIHEGVPYVGSSAGSVILGPDIELVKFADDPNEGSKLTSYDGLNIFPLVPLAHIDNPDYKDIYKQILNFGLEHDIPFVSLQEHQFILVEGAKWQIINAKK